MAYKNKLISNPKTGQEIKFLQTAKDTNGQLLQMEVTFGAYSKEPLAHYHPVQKEVFTVISGQIQVRLNTEVKILKKGDTLHIDENVVHAMWNNSGTKAVVNWKVQPALDTEYFLETTTSLASDGKTNENGVPGILQVAVMAKKFSHVFRLSKPPFVLQTILFSLLTPFALLAGYKPMYKKYID